MIKTTWLVRHALAAYRQKRFFRAAAILAWYRGVAVLAAALSLALFMGTSDFNALVRLSVGLLAAIGYLWMDVYYNGRSLKMRHQFREYRAEHLREMRVLDARTLARKAEWERRRGPRS